MDLSDRLAIETGICHKDSLKKIAKLLGRHPSTIAHEIKENRTFIPGNYFLGKDCKFVRQHIVHHLCGDMECEQNCCRCRSFDCQKHCEKYVSRACHKFDRAPYVCNNCPEKALVKRHCECKMVAENKCRRNGKSHIYNLSPFIHIFYQFSNPLLTICVFFINRFSTISRPSIKSGE